jgi:hypothetical protein
MHARLNKLITTTPVARAFAQCSDGARLRPVMGAALN